MDARDYCQFLAMGYSRQEIVRLERDYPDTPRIGDPRKRHSLERECTPRPVSNLPVAESIAFLFGLGIVLGLAILRHLI